MSFCVRLYNFMHYGQSNALSTMLVAAIAVPTVTVVLLARLRPLHVLGAAMSGRLWRLENVYVAGTVRPRLDGITVDVAPGTTAILGISGAGKTTFLNLLCGFGRPHRGRVEHLLPQTDGRLPLFWVPQNDGLWPHRTVPGACGRGQCRPNWSRVQSPRSEGDGERS